MILDEKTLISGNGFANNALFLVGITKLQFKLAIKIVRTSIKGTLTTKIVIFSYPKLLSFSALTFIK
jgi:hypothetical protein